MPHFLCGPLGPDGDSAQDVPPFSQHRNLSLEANRIASQNLTQVLAAFADGNGSVAIFCWCSCGFELRSVWGARGDAGLEAAIQEIAQSGQKIQQIIRTIDEIAFQTNLLTLNAAVEAAALLNGQAEPMRNVVGEAGSDGNGRIHLVVQWIFLLMVGHARPYF